MFEIVIWQAVIMNIYFTPTSNDPFKHALPNEKLKQEVVSRDTLAWTGAFSAFCGIQLPCQHVKLNTNASFYLAATYTGRLIHKVVWLSEYFS